MDNNRIWRAYLQDLERLNKLLEDQSRLITDKNWGDLPSITGSIENARKSLQISWQKVTADSGDEGSGIVIDINHKDEIGKAASLLKRILQTRTENESLMQEEMKNLKKDVVDLRHTAKSHKSYLSQK